MGGGTTSDLGRNFDKGLVVTMRKAILALVALMGIVSAQDRYAPQARSAVIAINTSLSAAVDLTGCTPAALEMPSAWTTAGLSFQGSVDNSTFNNLYDEFGTEITAQAAASRLIRLSPSDWWGIKYIKVRSGTSGTPVTQTSARTIKVICR